MTAFDPETAGWLLTMVRDVVGDWDDVESTTMFGCPSFRADGTLFLVLTTEGIALPSLPESDRDQLESTMAMAPFSAHGRTIGSWAFVPIEDASGVEKLRPFIEASYEAALADAG